MWLKVCDWSELHGVFVYAECCILLHVILLLLLLFAVVHLFFPFPWSARKSIFFLLHQKYMPLLKCLIHYQVKKQTKTNNNYPAIIVVHMLYTTYATLGVLRSGKWWFIPHIFYYKYSKRKRRPKWLLSHVVWQYQPSQSKWLLTSGIIIVLVQRRVFLDIIMGTCKWSIHKYTSIDQTLIQSLYFTFKTKFASIC